MRCGQHPLVGDQHAGTVENLARSAQNGGNERPVARRRNRSADDALTRFAQVLGADATTFCGGCGGGGCFAGRGSEILQKFE